ncbi:MAG TPA: YihY/virulence factor BrkB family protein [Mycobacteriales bacterium]|nr:YihY/virulence factor BrkB family protein [Mycobacteriales bacterium]
MTTTMTRPRNEVAPPPIRKIGVRGWTQVLGRVRYQLSNTNIAMLAAGAAFWTFLALFPAVIAIVTVWGMFASPTSVSTAVANLGSSVSPSMKQSLASWMNQIVTAHSGTLGLALLISLLALLWSVSGAIQNLMTGVTAAYEQEETRGFIKRRGTALLLTVGAIAVAILMVGAVSALSAMTNLVGTTWLRVLADVGVYVVMAGILFAAITTLYRVGASNGPADWRWAASGAKFSTLAVLATVIGFSFYVRYFNSYNKTYGALAGVVVFMLLVYYAIYVVFIGALLSAERQRQITGATNAEDYPEASPDNVRAGSSVGR